MKFFINEKESEASYSACYLEFQEGQYQMSKLIHMVVRNSYFIVLQ